MKATKKVLAIVLCLIFAFGCVSVIASAVKDPIYDTNYNYRTHVLSWKFDKEALTDIPEDYDPTPAKYTVATMTGLGVETTKTSVNISKLIKEYKKEHENGPQDYTPDTIRIYINAFDKDGEWICDTMLNLDLNGAPVEEGFGAKILGFFQSLFAFFGDLFAPAPIVVPC